MAAARWKDLCIDVADEALTSAFWAATLGLTVRRLDDGDEQLVGATPQHGVWLNVVPEPRTVKQRVHLDVLVRDVAELEALGATRLPTPDDATWTVLADPEGGELCAFVRDDPPAYRLSEVVVDCVDHERIASWWAALLGARLRRDERGLSFVEQVPGAPFASLTFVPVPEPKVVKNRIHWDVTVDDPEGLALLVDAGATVLAPEVPGDPRRAWTVMADPEGNEFCVFTP